MRRKILLQFGITPLVLACSLYSALAQEKTLKDQIVGTWVAVSGTATLPDGTKVDRSNSKSMVIYTADGHFAFLSISPDLQRIAANDRAKATAEEARAVVAGSIAYLGTYTVNEAEKTIFAKPEASTFANLIGGPEQRRVVTSISADEMRFTNPRTPAGEILEFAWRRAK